MSTEKSIIDQIAEQILGAVRDMEDSGFLDELAKAPKKAESQEAQKLEAPKTTDSQCNGS